MSDETKRKIEFGDFQTPEGLAEDVCKRLAELGVKPDVVIEPTCGVGTFVLAAAKVFPRVKKILGFEVNESYLNTLRSQLPAIKRAERIQLERADFFATNWVEKIRGTSGSMLVLGNFPWVTNSGQGAIGGTNLPEKTNFQGHNGFDAISGKANFDISEWMLLEVLRWFDDREGEIAMLVKTAVARKILSQAHRKGAAVRDAFLVGIDAKKDFSAAVDACLLVIRLAKAAANKSFSFSHDYTMFESLEDRRGHRVGHRNGLIVKDLDEFEANAHLLGESPQKWRSGIKHDLSSVMEFTQTERGLENGHGEIVELEGDYLYPLLKGSDIGSGKAWRKKFTLVTQKKVGEATDQIRELAPRTWAYLEKHGAALKARGSTIYAKNPPFSIFGVGDYSFRPWKIAICGLYKNLNFRLIGPLDDRTVMFDDTVYFVSFETEAEAQSAFEKLTSKSSLGLLSSLIFWDEKRPIKSAILNVVDWSKVDAPASIQSEIEIGAVA